MGRGEGSGLGTQRIVHCTLFAEEMNTSKRTKTNDLLIFTCRGRAEANNAYATVYRSGRKGQPEKSTRSVFGSRRKVDLSISLEPIGATVAYASTSPLVDYLYNLRNRRNSS